MPEAIEIQVGIVVTKRKKYWIAYCPALKTYGYSSVSKERALEDLDTALQTFFHVQETLGTLNKTLLNLGWQRGSRSIKAPTTYSDTLPFRKPKPTTTRQVNIPAYA